MKSKFQFYKLSRKVVILIILGLLLLGMFSGIGYSSGYSKEGKYTDAKVLMNNIVWNPTARLTWLGNSTNPQIMRSSDGNYNIVWQDDRNGNWDIYYLKVRPDGFKLVNDSRITYFSGNDTNPVLGVYGDHIYIVWQRFINGHWAIYFSRLLYSSRNILIEIPPKPIRKINANCVDPRIAVDSNGYIHVVWQEWNNSNWDIMYDELNSNGDPLFPPVDVSNTVTPSLRPDIVVDSQNNVHVFWIEYTTTPGYSIFYRKLSSNGAFLTEPRRISVVSPKTTVDSYYYNGSLYTVFSGSRERLAYEVIFTRLNSDGYTVVDDTNLTIADKIDSIHPHVAVVHNRMFVVWNDYPMGVIRFSIYDEEGHRIGKVLNLSSNNSFLPAISVNNQTIGVVWEKRLDNKTYLYFRSATFPDVRIESMRLLPQGHNITVEASIYSSADLDVEYGIYLDGKMVVNSSLYFEGTILLRNTISATPGWHTVALFLDPFNRIIETNETNNFREGRVYIKQYSFNITLNKIYYAPAGRWSNLTVLLKNTGNWEDNYSLMLSYNSTLFKIQPSSQLVHLSSQEFRAISFQVYPYVSTIVGNYTVNLTIRSLTQGIKETKKITIRVLPYVNFKIEYNSIYSPLPGTKLNMRFIIKNTGNCNDTYIIKVKENRNWPLIYKKSTLNVSYQSSRYFNLTLLIPNGTYGYTKNYVNLTVKSSILNITMNASVMVIVEPVHRVSAYVISFMRNGTYYYQIKLKLVNTGNMRDQFNLNLTGDAARYAYLSKSSILLNPGESTVLTINAYLPPYISAGTYKVNFNVYYQATLLKTIPILLTVEESHQFIVNVKKISEGKNVVLEATIRNVGNTPELIEILPQLVEKINATWILHYHGRNYTNVTTVYVLQNQTVNVTITLHSKLPSGEYKLRVTFKSASHITKIVTVKFRAGEETLLEKIADFIMSNIVYIVIAAVVVVGVVVYLIRFRE